VYLLTWIMVFGVAMFIVATSVTYILYERLELLSDDDWPLFIWPLGSALGIWFAMRSLDWRRFQEACLLLGIVVVIPCSLLAHHFSEKSERIRGVHGLLSGFAEGMTALAYEALAAVAIAIVIGSAAALIHRRIALR
jgi:hypothetical protein